MNFDADYAITRMAEIRDTTCPDQILIFLKLLTRMAAHRKNYFGLKTGAS